MWRLQVKTAREKKQKKSSCYQFKVRQATIEKSQTPELHFVFAMRVEKGWRFLIMDRPVLRNYVNNQKIGTPADKNKFRRFDIILHENGNAFCSKIDWTSHLEDWAQWTQNL
jgi:hypothetical protein